MAKLINQHDWSQTPLGHKNTWPNALLFTVDLLLNSAFPMFLFWGDELTAFYNDAFRPVLGKEGKHPTTLGKPGKLVWAEIWDSIEPLINSVLEGQSTGLIEDLYLPIYRNGRLDDAYWTFSYNPVKNDAGKVEGVLAICHETTKRVTEGKAMNVLHDQLALALDAVDLGTWDLNPNTMQFTCNEKTKEIFGLNDLANVSLETAINVIEPGDKQKIKKAIDQALDIHSGGRYHVEYTVVHPQTGERRMVKAIGKVFFNEDKKPEKFAGTIQDITDEKNASDRREKLLQLVENSNDYMSMATLDGRLTYMNPAGRQLVGLSADDDLSLLSIKDFYSDEQFSYIKNEVIPALEKDHQWSGTVHIKHLQSGEEIPCFGNYILVVDPITKEVISRAVTFRDLRPEIKAQKELEDSETRFRDLVQLAPVATAIYVGKEMRIQWANEAMIKLWGKDEQLIGKTLHEALPEIDDQPFHGQLQHVFETGEIFFATEDKGELLINGRLQTFYFNYSYKPLRDVQGNIYGILNMAIDVTEMVNNKRKLQESENAFRNLIMKAPVGICLLKGQDFIVDIANDQYIGLVGRSREELLHRPIWEVLPEAKAQGFDLLLEEVKKSGKPYFGNETPVHLIRNGKTETIYLNFVYEPLFDEEQSVYGILVLVIDISQQVRLRQQIEGAEERARLAVESGNFGTYEVNLLTGDVISSARFNELFDVDENGIQTDYVSKIHPDDLPVRKQAHERAMVTGVLEYECRIQRRDGHENWVQIHGQIYYDEQRQPFKIIGIVQDITEQKNSEQALEKRVQERTAELLRVNEELQQFIFISSHDLKEPLRKIQVFSSMAKGQAGNDTTKLLTSLDKVVRSASRMSSLLGDLAYYSTLSLSDQRVEEIDLNEVLGHVQDDLELLIKEKSAVINATNLPVIEGVGFQLNRLVYNLVHNALKFNKQGQPPQLSIQSALINNEEKTLLDLPLTAAFYRITFTDNGIGFDQSFAEKIFVVFQQLQAKDEHVGNGIGLAICKKVVTNHGGKLYAHSEVGKGSVFTVILPTSNVWLAQ